MLRTCWPSVHQCLSLLTSLSASLCNQLNSFWHQQSQQLCSEGSNTASHIPKLTQLGSLLPLLVTMLADIDYDSSRDFFQSMTFPDGIALHLQLLIQGHEASQAVKAWLPSATSASSFDPREISAVWETTVCTIQVSVCKLVPFSIAADSKTACNPADLHKHFFVWP